MENLSPFLPRHFSFEIKPKWGFTYDVFQRACRYCLHQGELVRNGQITHASKYCPLDLFSGNRGRIEKALENLFQDPHNNLIIKEEGKVLDTRLVKQKYQIIRILAEYLSMDPLLSRLKKGQRQFDKFSIDEIHPFYLEHKEYFHRTCCNNESKRGWEQDLLLALLHESEPKDLDGNNKVRLICEYLISMALKDCSIVISLTPSSSSIECHDLADMVQLDDLLFRCTIKVIDIDIKNHHKIDSHYNFHRKLVESDSMRLARTHCSLKEGGEDEEEEGS